MAQRTRIWQYLSDHYVLSPESAEIQSTPLESLVGDTIGHMILSVTPVYYQGDEVGHVQPMLLDSFFGVYVGPSPAPDPLVPQVQPRGWMLWDRLAYFPSAYGFAFYESAAELEVYGTRYAQQTGQTRFYESKGQRTVGVGDVATVIANMGGSPGLGSNAIELYWALRYLTFSGPPT